jgi:regulatory protein SWI5
LEPGIQASIEETNVTLDDIAQFIEGPDDVDHKWTCKYEDCNKRFGRKENIKSHVQTHLGDRQFRCDHCKKCFVRGHDLKRHAKIHTGSKPYPCLCGNAFARHDALTRHRQRGMCIGAFEGVVKKEVKRGRPRKHRPEMDDRVDKAQRTRNGTHGDGFDGIDVFDQYNSSASSCSYSSWGSPPTENMDALSMQDHHSPFSTDEIALFGVPQGMNLMTGGVNMAETMSFPPNMFSFTPPASPGFSTGNKPSPSHTHRSLTPDDVGIAIHHSANGNGSPHLTVQHLSPARSVHSQDHLINGVDTIRASALTINTSAQPHSLPSLSHSSSSPAAEVAAFDFADLPISTGSMGVGGLTAMAATKVDLDRNDFDAYFDIDGGMGDDDAFFTNL